MNISPMMIKAMFSALGVSPEQVMTPILAAVNDIQEFKATAQRIEERLINIENHLGINKAYPANFNDALNKALELPACVGGEYERN